MRSPGIDSTTPSNSCTFFLNIGPDHLLVSSKSFLVLYLAIDNNCPSPVLINYTERHSDLFLYSSYICALIKLVNRFAFASLGNLYFIILICINLI